MDAADEENKKVTNSVIDDELAGFYKDFMATLLVATPKGNGAVAKWPVEYEKVNEACPILNSCKSLLSRPRRFRNA